ncbi:MAG: 6-hydroxymethylpterin diphosphokinase MptE-like protein [Lachnospiraceae bacterium]
MNSIEEQNIYEKNMAAFEKEYPLEAEKLKTDCIQERERTIGTTGTKNGTSSITVTDTQGRTLLLEGVYEKTGQVQEQLENWQVLPNKTPIILIGLSSAEAMQLYLSALGEDGILLIYEPSIELFEYFMKHEAMEGVISNKKTIFLIDQLNEINLKDALSTIIKFETIALLKIVVSPNYEELFYDKVKEALNLINDSYENVMVSWNTARRFTNVVGKNVCYNLRHLFHGYNVSELKGMLKNEVPVFLISAGPSLNNNIEELRRAKGKACLIAVDTAIKPLLNRGIVPDFFAIVDGLKPTELMNHPRISEVPLVTCNVVAHGIMNLHQGKKFYYASGNELDQEAYEIARKAAGKSTYLWETGLPTGGSVANTAFSFAEYLQASKIIFVGQDLALTNHRTHADGTFQNKMHKLTGKELEDVVEVDGLRGNKVLTKRDFERYLRWFENYIKDKKMTNVIDATQGGAKIQGTRQMSLKRAIDTYCINQVNMEEKLEERKEMMDWGAKRAFLKFYQELPEKMHQVFLKAEKGERLYKQLSKLVKDEDYDKDKYRALIKKIGEVNNYMNTNNYGLFIQSTLMNLNFSVRFNIYKEKEKEQEEISSIAEEGKMMNYYIKEASRQWETLWKESIEECPLSICETDVQDPLDQLLLELEGK